MRNQKTKIIVAAATLVVGAAAVLGYTLLVKDKSQDNTAQQPQTTQQQNTPAPAPASVAPQSPAPKVTYDGVEGKNALELLQQNHKTETKTYEGMGVLVTSIDGTASDFDHFWSLYINGEQSQVGAESYMTKAGDKLEWKFEKIED